MSNNRRAFVEGFIFFVLMSCGQVMAGHTDPGGADFSLDQTSPLSVDAGSTVELTGVVNNFGTQPTTVYLDYAPDGVSATVSPTSLTDPQYTFTMFLSASDNVTPGLYPIQIALLNGSSTWLTASYDLEVLEGVIKGQIDIKPGSETNSINLSSAGVIPVAIMSTVDFDAAASIIPESVSLAGASVKVVGKAGKYLCHAEDINEDGFADLVCQVYTAEFLIEEGSSNAILEAETLNGKTFRAEDSITIVK